MPAFERLLGEHRWAEFLLRPSDEEEPRKTKIYWSTYGSTRQVDKEGWRRIDIQDAWFAPGKWTPNNEKIRFPYPPSRWCDLAAEDPTNKNFCRHIPKVRVARSWAGCATGLTVLA